MRPVIEARVFRDAEGRVVDYGNRWGMDSPPREAYGVVSHPERYALLHAVAETLLQHLVENYDVNVFDDLSAAADLELTYEGAVDRAVRVTPRDESKASLTFVFTPYPGVLLHVGASPGLDDGHDFAFPACGCDACDESPEGLIEDLEQRVFSATRLWG